MTWWYDGIGVPSSPVRSVRTMSRAVGPLLNDRPGEVRVRRDLTGGRRAELEPALGEVARRSLEVRRGHAVTVTGGAVADGAVVTEHALARREIRRLSRGPDRQPEPESGGEQGQRPGTRRQPGVTRGRPTARPRAPGAGGT